MSAMQYPDWDTFMTDWNEFIKGSFGDREPFPTLAPEVPSFMSRPVAASSRDLEGADVAIIGAPYVATTHDTYAGVSRDEWLSAPKRVRQQSARYQSGYIQDFGLDVFDILRVVDFGDAPIPEEVMRVQSAENILLAQQAVEEKVGQVLDAGAIPIVIGQNSPCSSYAIAKPIAERTTGRVGCVSLDTHWDIQPLDFLSRDPRIAGSASWKHKMYEFHDNMHPQHLVEIGERGMLEKQSLVEAYINQGARFISSWEIREGLGMKGVAQELDRAYKGTDAVYVHFDMDVMGGAGPAPGDILGEAVAPIGLSDYEIIKIAHEVGKRGVSGMSFICIPPGSAIVYRVIVYIVMYMLAGIAMSRTDGTALLPSRGI